MRKKKKYVVGIDLGGTKIMVGLLNKKFRVISYEKIKTEASKGEKYFLKTIFDALEEILSEEKVKSSEIQGIGIGCPGVMDEKRRVVVSSPNLAFLNHFPLSKKIESHFDRPAVLENDVNAGLYGEHQFGAAKGYSSVVGIFLGTGIGGGLILDHKLYRGASGAAGEIGHLILDVHGSLCGCGKRGCLEAIASRLALASEAAVLAYKQKAPKLMQLVGTDISKIKSNAMAKSIASGDHALLEMVHQKSELLGLAMAHTVNLLNPELIVLGGGVLEAMEKYILPKAEAAMKKYAMTPLAREVKVVAAKLQDFAVLMGAAKLAWDEV
ncbi:MAG: ROK family protein [Candidatus Omnitrophica bacterium]|nr:ROK family protein [Candidatus Omnitrophota bacterium]